MTGQETRGLRRRAKVPRPVSPVPLEKAPHYEDNDEYENLRYIVPQMRK
jgi:hypothetical protein